MRLTCVLLPLLVVGACRDQPETPLARAAVEGRTDELARLLAQGGVDTRDGDDLTALHWAARAGQPEAIRMLLKAGAAIDRKAGVNHWTPLMHAIHKRQGAAAAVLIEAGADVNARGARGTTPLMLAAGYGEAATVRLLLARGADPYARTVDGLDALWGAAGGGAIADITDGPPIGSCSPEAVDALLEKAPDLHLRGGLETRALSWLARSKDCRDLLARLRRG